MKLGLSMWSVVHLVQASEMDQKGFIEFARECQVDGVELLDFFQKGEPDEVEGILESLNQTNLPCSVFSVSNNFAKPDPQDRDAALQRVLSGIEKAQLLGAKVVRVFGGDDHERKLTLDDAFDWIVDGLAEASKVADQAGIQLGLENHGSMAGRSDQVRRIIEAVRAKAGNNALGANLDTGNFVLVSQDSVEAATDLADLINMVHFKDFASAPAGWDGFAYKSLDGQPFVGTALGEGSVDLAGVIKVLKQANFQGWMNLEYEGAESARTAIPRSIEFARSVIGG